VVRDTALPDRLAAALRRWDWECAWAAFAVANLVWMIEMPAWVSVPFHFIWVSLAVLFGFRLWRDAFALAVAVLVAVSTGIVLIRSWVAMGMAADELLEIPLMFAMFLAMMLHTRRRRAATLALQRISDENARVLQRERSFIQSASHELRTPITIALAHAELAHQSAAGQPSLEADVEVIADELERLRGLTDRLLALAAADVWDRLRKTPTDLASLVDAAQRRWAPTPRRWLVDLQHQDTVLADRDQITLALDAVIDNAIKVTEEGRPIELSTARGDGYAIIEVRDSGPGIASELIDELFEPFTSGGPRRSATGGFGLGLPSVNAIVQAHGGFVTAANRPEGGAVIALHLPLADQHASAELRVVLAERGATPAGTHSGEPIPLV
jgi:signal transduction histidine kinase